MITKILNPYCTDCGEPISRTLPHNGILWWQKAIPYPCSNRGKKMVELTNLTHIPWIIMKEKNYDRN